MAVAAIATSTNSHFYLPIPKEVIWYTVPLPRSVIEVEPFTKDDPDLLSSQKTDEFVQQHFKVIDPADCKLKYIKRDDLVPCSGPARKLGVKEYIALYHSIDPTRELPIIFDRTIDSTRRLREDELPVVANLMKI